MRPVRLLDSFSQLLRVPRLTRGRMVFALIVALLADALQAALGPFGWTFLDEIIDVVVMTLTTWALGFHLLLLPTFVVELIPLVDMLPTWTACVLAVIARRKREQGPLRGSPPSPEGPSQDISRDQRNRQM